MQIIESTSFEVRAVVATLARAEDDVRFCLFPMVHIAEPGFYDEVMRQLTECDEILAEGIRHRSASLLTLSYRFIAGSRRLGLVSQQSRDWSPLRPRMTSADLDGPAFAKGWRAVPIWTRTVNMALAPIVGLVFRLIGSREQLARVMAIDLLPDRVDIERPDDMVAIDGLLRDARDKALITAADHAASGNHLQVGVVFGATHMRPLLRHLLESGYRIVGTEFVTVMSLVGGPA